MESAQNETKKAEECRETAVEEKKTAPAETLSSKTDMDSKQGERAETSKKASKEKSSKKRHGKAKAKKGKKSVVSEADSTSSLSEFSDSSSTSTSEDETETESEDNKPNKNHRSSKRTTNSSKNKARQRHRRRSSKAALQSTSSESDVSDTSSGSNSDEDESSLSESEGDDTIQRLQQQVLHLQQQINGGGGGGAAGSLGGGYGGGAYNGGLAFDTPRFLPPLPPSGRGGRARLGRGLRGGVRLGNLGLDPPGDRLDKKGRQRQKRQKDKRRKKQPKLDYKRVDQVWDNSIHNYKLQDTADTSSDSQYEDFLFHIRRTFDWEGKHKATYADIKSKLLRECLQEVMGNLKGVSLVEETPKLDPNLLFLYLEDMREHLKTLKRQEPKAKGKKDRRKEKKKSEEKRKHLKVLVRYLDKDYAQVKKSLYPMLENGLITFDLLWALWKPNTLAYTSTYGCQDEPRVFKVETAEKHFSIMKGDLYYIEGKYFEYDGKQFGFGNIMDEISEFRGARKITSLGVFPLEYLKNKDQIREQLIERGKKFVSLSGVHYRSHHGMAFFKKKKAMIKVNINGRIMVDSSIHRRINPNYPISLVRPKDHDIISEEYSSDESDCECDSDSDDYARGELSTGEQEERTKYVIKVYQDRKGNTYTLRVPKDDLDDEGASGKLELVESKKAKDEEKCMANGKEAENVSDESKIKNNENKEEDENKDKNDEPPEFSDEEYLIASPVVLGFAFAEKLWLEFTVSGVKEIQWNEQAYESLVLETKTKDIVKVCFFFHDT